MEPDASPCACGSHDRIRIGEDVSERLDVVPAKFRVIVTRRPKYACKTCRDGVAQASAPARLIEAGLPTEALLAHVAVSKYADGLPLYRQDNIYRRDGVELGRNLMAGWMGRVGFHLEPLAARVLDHIRAGPRIFADETTLPTLDPGRGKTKSAWLWAYARDDRPFGGSDPPMVAYRFEDGRGGDHPARHLAGFTGILQVDVPATVAEVNTAAPSRDHQRHTRRRQTQSPVAPLPRSCSRNATVACASSPLTNPRRTTSPSASWRSWLGNPNGATPGFGLSPVC